MTPMIGHVRARDPYVLQVWWADGLRRGRVETIDLGGYILLGQFRALRGNPPLWKLVEKVGDGEAITWGGSLEILASTLERLAQEQDAQPADDPDDDLDAGLRIAREASGRD